MRVLKRKKEIKLFFFLPLLGLFLLLVFLVVCNVNVFEKIIRLKGGLKEFAQKAKQNEQKPEEATLLLEKIAREELNYKKPGEHVVAFPMANNSTTSYKMDLEGKAFWQWIISKTRE